MASMADNNSTGENNTDIQLPAGSHDLQLSRSSNHEIFYSRQDQIHLGNDRRNISVENSSYVNIAVGNTDYPGVAVKDTLELMIKDAEKDFVESVAYRAVKQKLEERDCITISGAPGEGKTTMALMLAKSYRKQGYEIVFVDNISVFKPGIVLRDCSRVLVILDDIFGTGEPEFTANTRQILKTMQLYVKHSKPERGFSNLRQSREQDIQVDERMNKPVTQRKVIFTSKTYNLKCGLESAKQYKNVLFEPKSQVNLTTQKDLNYSDEEKKAIFLKLKLNYFTAEDESDILSYIPDETFHFGFPLICKLYFQSCSFHKDHLEFFTNPLQYLRREMDAILMNRDSRASILSLLFILDRPFSLSELDVEEELKYVFMALRENEFSCQRIDMIVQAKALVGTYFKVDGKKLSFAHSSIYDAVACSLAERHILMILKFSNIEFLCNRIRVPPDTQDVVYAEVDEYLNLIYISEDYYDMLIDRLLCALEDKQFCLVLSYAGLNSKIIVDKLMIHVPISTVISKDKKSKSFLFWTTYNKSGYLCQKTIKVCTFPRTDTVDALQACASNGNKEAFVSLNRTITLNKDEMGNCLIYASKNGQINMVQHLLDEGANILHKSLYGENSLLVACEHGFTDIVKLLSEYREGQLLQTQLLIRKSVAISDTKLHLSPVMKTILHSHEDTFTFLMSKNVNISEETAYGNCLHLAAHSGNVNIVKEITSKNHFSVDAVSTAGYTPLIYSCISGSNDVYEHLVSLGADIRKMTEAGTSVLHWASFGGNVSIVEDVLNRTGQEFVNFSDKVGFTPIMYAARNGHTEVFHFLESHGADIKIINQVSNVDCLQFSCASGKSQLVSHLAEDEYFDVDDKKYNGFTSWMIAAGNGNTAAFDIVFHRSRISFDYRTNTTLDMACKGGSISIVMQLTENDRFLCGINIKNEQGLTPLMTAVANGHFSISKHLLTKDADINTFDNDDDKRGVLHYACIGGNVDIVMHLIEEHGMDVNTVDGTGYTPIMYSVLNGRRNTTEYLQGKGADEEVVPSSGTSLLHLACQGGDVDFVNTILETRNVDIDMRDRSHMTPLLYAARSGNAVIVECLVKRGADLKLSVNGNTVLHYGSCGNAEVLRYLISVSHMDIDSWNDEGMTPLMVAVLNGNIDVVYFLKRAGANINAKDRYGNTLLHLVPDLYTVIQVYLMIGYNSDQNNDGNTPLMVSVIAGKVPVFDYLISKCNRSEFFANGSTLLHLACSKGHVQLVNYMLSKNLCDINYRDAAGMTPVKIAFHNGHMKVYKLLRNKGIEEVCSIS